MNCIQTKTGDIMHVSECNENDVTYGVISVTLKNSFNRLSEAEAVLLQFMRQLQPIFTIVHATGIDATPDVCPTGRAFINYWQDEEQRDWKIKGWTDGATVTVRYIKNITQVPVAMEDYFFSAPVFAT